MMAPAANRSARCLPRDCPRSLAKNASVTGRQSGATAHEAGAQVNK